VIMADAPTKVTWPTEIGPRDDLFAIVDDSKDHAEFLVFASEGKGKTFIRNNGAWFAVDQRFFDELDNPNHATEFVDIDFIEYYDEKQRTSDTVPFYSVDDFAVSGETIESNTDIPAVIAAVEDGKCPPATQDVSVNLRNRRKAIERADYGPLNPAEENTDYWVNIADLWGVSAAEAKKSTCGNCVFFYVTTKIRDCIASGISSGDSVNDPWDSIDAGDLGYCEAFDFKCASSRTCAAWATGGPITDEKGASE
jgi:hypothetical protein